MARVISDAAAASVAQVGQTVGNNASVSQSSTDAAGGSFLTRRVTISVSGSSAAILPLVTTTLPNGAYVAWIEATGDLVDTCSFVMVDAQVLCHPKSLRSGLHTLTIVYGQSARLFRDGFE